MAAFSTPFWTSVAGVVVIAVAASHLSRPVDLAGPSLAPPPVENKWADALGQEGRPLALPDDATATQSPQALLPSRAVRLLVADAAGRLVVTEKTLFALEALLAELPPRAGRPDTGPLQATLRAHLPSLAADRAWGLLRSLVNYREAEKALREQLKAQAPLSASDLLERTMALRRRHFDSVSVQELFGLQESSGVYAADVARILGDATLSEAQQAQQIQALRLNLPPAVLLRESGSTGFSFALERHVAQMRAEGQPEAEVSYLRQQYVDVEGVQSVLEIENEKQRIQTQVWEQRNPMFVRQRSEVLASSASEEDKLKHIDQLLQQHFRPDEIDAARAHIGR